MLYVQPIALRVSFLPSQNSIDYLVFYENLQREGILWDMYSLLYFGCHFSNLKTRWSL